MPMYREIVGSSVSAPVTLAFGGGRAPARHSSVSADRAVVELDKKIPEGYGAVLLEMFYSLRALLTLISVNRLQLPMSPLNRCSGLRANRRTSTWAPTSIAKYT
jgi:hypothetical protein